MWSFILFHFCVSFIFEKKMIKKEEEEVNYELA